MLIAAHAWYGDTIGGSFRLATEFAEYLAAADYRVTYVCCAPDSQPVPRDVESADGIQIRRYPPPPDRLVRFGRLRYHVAQTRRLVREISREALVDALSGHSPLQFLGAAQTLSSPDVSKIFTVHSPFDDELSTNATPGRRRLTEHLATRAARWVDRRCVRLADRVQADSHYTLRVMSQKHGKSVTDKGIVAPGWVDTGNFQPAADRHAVRGELGEPWQTDDPVFFTLRRLEARMGLETLVEAAHQLVREQRTFRVLIAGDGSLRPLLEEMVDRYGLRNRVYLLGRLPAELVPKCYAAADCFVLPTRALECFGLIVLEAFAANTPVIASNVAAIPEIAARQGDQWLFPPGDANTLATKMRQFLDGQLEVSAHLRSIAEEYERARVLERWEELLEQGARGGASSGAVDLRSRGV